MLKLFLGLLIPLSIIISIFLFYLYQKRSSTGDSSGIAASDDIESGNIIDNNQERLMFFQGGEDLTVADILDAPGEVIGKSSYGILYKACLSINDSNLLLRFWRPACSGNIREVITVVHSIGLVRHPKLVPLQAFCMGPRGEKLLVSPYFVHGNLAQFIKGDYGILTTENTKLLEDLEDKKDAKDADVDHTSIGVSEIPKQLHNAVNESLQGV